MSRALSATMQTIIERGTGELLVAFLEFGFGNGIVRITTAPVDISWNGFTWEGVGGHCTIGGITESPGDDRSQGSQLELSGVDPSLLAILLQRQYQGRPVRAWLGHINMGANALLRSRAFNLSPWSLTQATISANAGTTDDGRLAADKLVEAASENFHRIEQSWTIPAGRIVTIACKVRSQERTRGALVLHNGSGNAAGLGFNLATGATADIETSAGVVHGGALERLAGGGALVWLYAQLGVADTAATWTLELHDGTGASFYTGDGSSGLFAWDAQAIPVQARLPCVETADVGRADGVVADAPYPVFAGYMNGGFEIEQSIDTEVASCEIRMRVVSRTADLMNRRGIKTNVQSHQAFFPGDRFFQFVPQLVNRTLTWGSQRVHLDTAGYRLPSTPMGGHAPGDIGFRRP